MPGLAHGFRPDMLSGLVFWANGSRYAAADATAEATLSNLAPTGSANDATQPTGGNQPLFKSGANGINGRGVLRFDGTDDFMFSPVDLSGANTNFVVFKCRSLPGGSSFQNILTFKGSAGSVFDELLLCNFAGLQPYSFKSDYQATGNAVGIADALDTNAHVFCYTYDGSGNITNPSAYTCLLDGISKTVIASGAFARASTDKGAMGARCSSGNVATLNLNGDIGEVIRYNRQLSTYEQAVVVKYLRTGWGI